VIAVPTSGTRDLVVGAGPTGLTRAGGGPPRRGSEVRRQLPGDDRAGERQTGWGPDGGGAEGSVGPGTGNGAGSGGGTGSTGDGVGDGGCGPGGGGTVMDRR
jgi:hypothetical protein